MGTLIVLFATAWLVILALTLPVLIGNRRARRAAAEEAEYARITGWITEIRPAKAGPAITRDKNGQVDLFRGLRRYAPSGRRTRRSRRA